MSSEVNILDFLKPHQVKSVKKINIKLTNSEKRYVMQNSTTVLLHFTSLSLPNMVNTGYMTFKTRVYIGYPSPYDASNAIVSGMLH